MALVLAVASCEGRTDPHRTSRPERSVDETPSAARGEEPAPAAYAPVLGDRPSGLPARRDVRAIIPDEDYSGTEPVAVRRLVFRVVLRPPLVLGSPPPTFHAPAAELLVDVSEDRLHARFVGLGWPVVAGAEVRLRRDRPGAYVFDALGGRPVPPRHLASWFQGGPVGRWQPGLAIRPAPPSETGPGELVCALLAELSNQDREAVVRRCAQRAPALFRLGPWRGERTADVPVELPRSAMRADEQSLPDALTATESRAFLEPGLLARLEPTGRALGAPSDEAPGEGLAVRNESPSRAVVLVHGVAVGWVDPGATGHFVGLRPGEHTVAAMRPLGSAAAAPRDLIVPGELILR